METRNEFAIPLALLANFSQRLAGCWALALVFGTALGLFGADRAPMGQALARDMPVAMQIRVLATTDLHSNLMDYDYYRDQADPSLGLVRTASLIKKARSEQANAILVDAGDLLQGAPLADAVVKAGLANGQIHPDILAMNKLGYDAATLGNHDFNYGLGFLDAAMKGARFPFLSANVLKIDRGHSRPLVQPGVMLKRRFRDILGKSHLVQIGVVGSTPPQILTWDKDKLTGKIEVREQAAAVRDTVAKLRADGADVVIVVAHTGIGPVQARPMEENAGYQFTKIRGVDAVVLGHSHQVFPSEFSATLPNADLAQGTINGKPVVMAGYYGSHLGVIDLTLKRQGKRFVVVSGRAEARGIQVTDDGKRIAVAEPDPVLVKLLEPAHKATLAFAKTPIARTDARIHTYLVMLGDTRALGIAFDAVRAYSQSRLKGTEWEKLPLLVAIPPFKAGGRYGATNYTDIAPGEVQWRSVADLYLYANTLSVVKLTGAELREWLEKASRVFETIDPKKTEAQALINQRVPAYNFDIMDGITYTIDLTEPERYDRGANVIRPDAHRINDLERDGQPIKDDDVFLVATSNYRADGGDSYPGLDGTKTILQSPDTIQEIIAKDLAARGDIKVSQRQIWSFADIDGAPNVTFDVPTREADIAGEDKRLQRVADQPNGMTRYRFKLPRDSE